MARTVIPLWRRLLLTVSAVG